MNNAVFNNISEYQKAFSGHFPFWNKLSQDDKELLCKHTVGAEFKKGQNIHGANGGCGGGVLVKSGCIRAYMLSEDGREITLYRLFPEDICMLSASCVIKAITFDVLVDAEEDSEVYIINGGIFKEISDRNLEVENFALNVAVSRFSEVMWVMQQILFMSLDKRLAIFLLDEIARTGSTDIKLTHEQIAKYMGSAREVVSRMMKYFSSEGIAELYRGGIKVINKEKLRKLSGTDFA